MLVALVLLGIPLFLTGGLALCAALRSSQCSLLLEGPRETTSEELPDAPLRRCA